MKNTNSKFAIDHVNKTITATKTTLKKASNPNSAECAELLALTVKFSAYGINEKVISTNGKKNSYAKLTYVAMENYITVKDGENAGNLSILEKVIAASASQSYRYGFVKSWFLANYPDYKDYNALTDNETSDIPVREVA